MKTLVVLSAGFVLALALAPPPVAALDFNCLLSDVVELVFGGQGAYLAIDEIAGSKSLYSIWGYLEWNGVAGLQRGGTTPLGDTDPCQEDNPDLAIF